MNIEPYYATDMRVYDGCPSSDLQRQYDNTDRLYKLMQKIEPLATCCYFPVEGKYMTFRDHKPITDVFHSCKQQTLIEAIQVLTEKQNEQKL